MKKSLTKAADKILLERRGDAEIVRFNRPRERNPLSVEVLQRLDAILDAAFANPEIEKIIFTGSEDVFASGANLNEIAALDETTAAAFGLRGQTLMQKIYRAEKLCVAAINGFCFGGALDLAMSCQKRVASSSASFSHPGANLGIMTGWGGTQLLPRLVGEAKALEMFLTAKRVSAEEALRIGLIDVISANSLADALKIGSGN